MQIKEGGTVQVDEIVAVTMGPDSAQRALHKAVSLGADRSVQLTDDALAGSDVCASGYALAAVLKKESPDLVLLGQQSDDGECYTMGAVVADHLQMPSLTQVIKIDTVEGKLTCERQAEYGYDTVEVELPAVISVGDAINEPRYPSLKAIMGAKKKQLDKLSAADAGVEADRVGEGGSRTKVLGLNPPPAEGEGHDHRGRGHERDGREDRRLARRKEADLDARDPGLRPARRRGQLQQELAGRGVRGRAPGRRARHPGGRGGRRRRLRRGRAEPRRVRRREGAPRQERARGARAADRRRDGEGHHRRRLRLRAVRRRPARLRDRRRPDRAARRRRDDGGHRACKRRRTASWSPSARSSRTRRSPTSATSASRASSSAG